MGVRSRKRLGWAHVAAARLRRGARGRVSWIAEDLSEGRGLPPLDDLPGLDDRSDTAVAAGRSGRPVLRAVPDPGPEDATDHGPPVADRTVVGPEDETGLDDGHGGPVDGPGRGPVRAGDRSRGSLMPDRPVREDQPAVPADHPGGVWMARGGRALVPGWLAHPVTSARRVLAFWAHVALFHGIRVPEYLLRALRWAPRGLYRSLVGLGRWATDAEAKELRWSAAARDDVREYLHLSRQRNQRVHNRGLAALVLVVTVLCAVTVGVVVSPWSPLTRIAVVLGVVLTFGAVGAPADRPWLDHATVPPNARRVTPDLLVGAFAAAKLCSLDADRPPGPIRFLSPIAHDGPGVRAVIDLPAGQTATEALARREKIAAGLDIDEFRVFLERLRGTAGSARRVVVWIADRDPYELNSPTSPLAQARVWDFWKPFPFGVDARGREVAVPLVWSSLLVGSIPRMGKTNAARLPAVAAALDPTTRMIVFDGKGGKDWKPFDQVAHFYAAGVRTAVVEALVVVLREAVEDMGARYERMADLPDDICPEGKVTPHITRRSSYGMPLTVIFIDEVHRYLEHPEHGQTIYGLLTELAKAGPAAGYMLVLATQRPDAKVVPEGLRGQMGTRFALRVMNWQASETILGAGTYTAGLDASKFLRSHLGVGILVGADDNQATGGEAITVRTHLLDLATLRQITKRGRELREKAGTLTGMAAGDTVIPETPARRLLDDLLDMFEPGEDRAWSETLCARLADHWPEVYDGWDPTTLANVLRPFGVETGQVWGRTHDGTGANRRGVARQALLHAISQREPRPPKASNLTVVDAPVDAPEGGSGRWVLAAGPARSSTPHSGGDQAPSD